MKKLVALLSSLPDPAMIIGRDLTITYQNEASRKAIGEWQGVKCHNAVEDDCYPCADCPAVTAFEEGEHRQVLRTSGGKAFGPRRYLEVSATPLKDESGSFSECLVLQRDLTDVKETEKQKKDRLSMLSHDLRSPLTIIHSYTDLLLDSTPGHDTERREMLSHIKRSAEVSVKLLDDFLTLSTIEAGKMELSVSDASLGGLARLHAGQFSALAMEKGITLHMDTGDGLPAVRLDEKQYGRVISNIVANAIKYSGQGTNVWVRTGTLREDPFKVYLEVLDEGPGIPEDDLPHVTERYYRADAPGRSQGTGLGLTIVKAITELHKGTVEITNRPEGGTSVRVVLPTSSTH